MRFKFYLSSVQFYYVSRFTTKSDMTKNGLSILLLLFTRHRIQLRDFL